MLKQTLSYMVTTKMNFEIIIVNDEGMKKDKTTDKALAFSNYEGREIDIKVVEY